MASKFNNAFNKFAKFGTSVNRTLNSAIGKDVFGDIQPIEEPREFPPYDSFPQYEVVEPAQWTPLQGADRVFSLGGSMISVSANLDACIQYRSGFKTAAKYYAERFAFKYKACAQDFDSLLHYFPDLYYEGLKPMLNRAYSLLLPFGVFSVNLDTFSARHMSTYKRAIASYEAMAGIEASKNQVAEQAGDLVGGAVQMQGGGFGLKGAMKGIVQAEAFNAGMGLLGKFVSHQTKMTPEEKEKAFSQFKQDIFFQEVYSDYYNTFLTVIKTLAENNELRGVQTLPGTEYNTMIQNLQNPMFPQDKIAASLAKLISSYPFEPAGFQLLQQKFGQTDEVKQITAYFMG